MTIGGVLIDVLRHPVRHLVWQWNWKSAVISACARALIFFAANLPAGVSAGIHALQTELLFRGVVSGALGSLTQSFSRVTPPGRAIIVALIVLPAVGHAAEFLVHFYAGTARLGASVMASIGFSVLTTAFNLFAMRQGALVVGPGRSSLSADMRRLPSLVLGFVRLLLTAFGRGKKKPSESCPTPRCI